MKATKDEQSSNNNNNNKAKRTRLENKAAEIKMQTMRQTIYT